MRATQGPQTDLAEANQIFPELPKLYAASFIKDAEYSQASFYAKSCSAVRRQLYGRSLPP
jgi:hypothetical protein